MRTQKWGLSLRGGGAKCATYIGVLQALIENDLRPDAIIATSGGACVAAGYACGLSFKEIMSYANDLSWRSLVGIESITTLSMWDLDKALALAKDFTRRKNFNDLSTKLLVQVTNVKTGTGNVITQGSVARAITATCAFPFLMSSLEIDGEQYMDGALSAGNGVKEMYDMDIHKVIVFSPDLPPDFGAGDKNPVHRIAGMLGIGMHNVREQEAKFSPPNLDLEIPITTSLSDMSEAEGIARQGYEYTIAHLSEIKKVLQKPWWQP